MGIVGNPKSIVTDGLIFHVDTGNISSYDHDQSQRICLQYTTL